MQHLKKVFQLLSYHWRPLLFFEVVYKVVSYAIAIPLIKLAATGIMFLTGTPYLTRDNLFRFILHPVTIIFMLVLFFLMTFYSLLDIAVVIYILDRAYQKKGVSILEAIKFALKSNTKVFRPGCIAMVGYVLFMIPFIHLGVSSGMITSIVRPEYIMDTVHNYWYWMVALYGGTLVIAFFLMRWLYIFHYFTLENCDFHESKVRSVRLAKKHWHTDALVLVAIEVVLYLSYQLITLLTVVILAALQNLPGRHPIFGPLGASVITVSGAGVLVVFHGLTFPFIYAVISILYYTHKESIGEEVLHPEAPDIPKKALRTRVKVLAVIAFAVSVVLCSVYTNGLSHGRYNLMIEHVKQPEITAHRGASPLYPENTMAAFEGAYRQGTDWIELDVQQISDGTVIVMHDANLKRLCGVNKKVWELTSEELPKYRVLGKEPICLLSEALDFSRKTGVRLNIELKPSGKDKNLEEAVIDLVHSHLLDTEVLISSLNYNSIKKVKRLDPLITTAYITDVAAGRLEDIEDVDIFAIEPTFVTPYLVRRLHNNGKQLMVWIVDTEENLDRCIALGVDNITTDDVPLAKSCIQKSRSGNVVTQISDRMFEIFR